MDRTLRVRPSRRGGILLTTLIFAVIIATILAGLGTLVISFYSRVTTESEFAGAINLADAGANYELRKINQSVNNADLPGTATPPGTTVTFGAGTFRVYCTMSDGVTSWDKQTVPFCIVSSATVGTVSRSIKISATGTPPSGGSTAVFAVVSGINNGGPTIDGSVGTDGTFLFNGNPVVTGQVVFNGPGSGWSPTPFGTYNTLYNATAISYPTVTAVALTQFPNSGTTIPGGLSYLATHNDNALASPPITSNSIFINGAGTVTLVGKPGGANYYITSLLCNGTGADVEFNNTNGPITVWQATGGSGTFTFNGGTAAVKMSTDSTKPVKMYIATTSGVTLNGNNELDAGIYNVTGSGSTVTFNGTPNIYGEVICDKFTFNGSPTVHATSGYFGTSGQNVYSFNNYWVEVNGI